MIATVSNHSRNAEDFPYDAKHTLAELQVIKGPDRLRWIRDREMAQTLLDLWHNIQARDAKRRAPSERKHWTEAAE